MHRHVHRMIAALLLAMLPWQGFAGATMLSCARAAVPDQSAAVAPCHEPAAADAQGTAREAVSDLAEWSSCSGCAQCHACSASVLPMTAGSTVASSPLQPAFAPPAPIAGVVLEHLDPPPVG